jgi:phospholipid/cholesterol/gamma-HCH transport system permease protein
VIAGRVGGGLASQLGTMRVTEQIDALEVMGINPYRFIVLPRVIASIISIPILTTIAAFISISAALIFTTYVYGMPYNDLVAGMRRSYEDKDLLVGVVKSIVFGIIITFISCYEGFKSEGGAIGVGLSAMRAVVYSSVLILVSDFIISYYFYGG